MPMLIKPSESSMASFARIISTSMHEFVIGIVSSRWPVVLRKKPADSTREWQMASLLGH